jgi:molybdopterin/thiamine biosynthesis adenylyltransferase
MTNRPWWEDYPQRLEREYQALRDAGIPFEVDEPSFARGIARITIHPTVGGVRYDIEVTFPDLYPYFRFEARAYGLALPHHQNPVSKQLCLIGRATDQWNVQDTVADLVGAQLGKLLRSVVAAPDERAVLEEHQGEPISEYFPYMPHSSVLVDGSWVIDPAIRGGTLTIGFSDLIGGRPQQVIRAAVLKIQDSFGNVLYEQQQAVAGLYARPHKVVWTRLDTIEVRAEPKDYFDSLATAVRRREDHIGVFDGTVRVRAAIFPEEAGYNRTGQGWLFAVQFLGWPKPKGRPMAHYLARVHRYGRADATERAPEVRPLASKRIAQVGVGCIGGPSALEFARAGVGTIGLLDGDHVDAATTVRWPFGLAAAGHSKIQVVKEFIDAHYPYTTVTGEPVFLGLARHDGEMPVNEQEIVARLINGASLIYDASAEFGIQFYLSQVAAELGIPYIGVAGRQGGWGGYVVRITPGLTKGCWSCLQLSWDSRIPSPPRQPADMVQPAGCGSPTFLAAGFDMTSIAMHGVRVAVGELCRSVATGYPASDWDVLVIAMRDANGRPIPPKAEGYILEPHPDCATCAQSQAA